MEIINFLAEILAFEIAISPAAARGLIKLAFKDKFGPFKDINEIDLQDLKNVVMDSLKARLVELNIKNVEEIINKLGNELILNQSLISITKI